jgi:hypothetical protein
MLNKLKTNSIDNFLKRIDRRPIYIGLTGFAEALVVRRDAAPS